MFRRAISQCVQAAFVAAWCALIIVPVAGQNIVGNGIYGDVKVTAGCSQATTFLARTSGLSPTETSAYTALICGLVSDGNFSRFDALYIFATNNTTTAALNLVSTNFTIVPHGTLTFTADTGWAGNGTTGYLDTTFIASTAISPQYVLNSGTIAIYNRSTPGASAGPIGANITSSFSQIVYVSGSTSNGSLNGNSNANTSSVGNQGLLALTRTSAAGAAYYKNNSATAVGTAGITSVAVQNISFFICGINVNGILTIPTTDQFAAAYIGAGLTGAQAAAVSTRINAYMTALGVNVY